MDWKEFISQIIDSLAWPLVVMFIVWQLKDKLGDLLPRLRKVKHKDTELEFAELVTELVSEAKSVENVVPASEAPNSKENFDFLVKLAEISPRSAVLESFRAVESAASIALTKAYPDLESNNARNPMQMFDLLRGKVLSDSQFKQLNDLRRLRNKAAHMEDFSLHGTPIEAYIDIALTIANGLASYEP
ncbi:hypothetical protein [Rheinheimera sp. KL1]|uniref:hypothetical protein n=1 Tax=Rheinheimera sp. KL1 TaxID=1635005 RepID=UPI0006A94C6C|nr:hypothetical protein [Rheinheimera sp. KL1]